MHEYVGPPHVGLGNKWTLESGVLQLVARAKPFIVCGNACVASPTAQLCTERRFWVSTCQLYVWYATEGVSP
jgi:hypothetical protein